jgi:biopolymer transport protein ExbD
MARKHSSAEDANIDLTPMLDVTFIMLIFFIVTTSFVKEAGLDVRKPEAATTEAKQRASIMIAVSETGQVWMQKRQIEIDAVRPLVEAAKSENPEGSAMIIADRGAPAGVVIAVMDQARLGGVTDIAIAAQHQTQ